MAANPEILDALTSGIQSEVASYVFYLEAAKKIGSDKLKTLLRELADEERKHFTILERQYDSLVRSEKWISTADAMKEEKLCDIGEDMTSRHRTLVEEVRNSSGEREILDIALRLEYEARDLFARLAPKAGSPEGKKMFEYLSRFEQTHVDKIKRIIADLG
jgi:rubrerythrin